MSDPIIILLLLTALLNFVLGIVVLWNRKTEASAWFGWFAIFLGIWTVTMIGYRLDSSAYGSLIWMRLAYVAAIFIGLPFWYFAHNFPTARPIRLSLYLTHWFCAFLFSSFIFFTGLVVRNVDVVSHHLKAVDQNPLGWLLYTLYFLFYFGSAHVILFLKYRHASGIEKKHLKFLFSSVLVGGEIFGVFFNLILPSPIFNEWRYIWTGPVLTTIVIVPFIAYAITKYRLLDIKLIATETFVGAAVLLAFGDAFSAHSVAELALRLSIFVSISVLGYYIIHSVLAEIHRREQTQQLAVDLATVNEKLEEISEMKSSFVSIASHQLRAPIGGVRGYLLLMHDGDFGKVPKKFSTIFEQCIDQLDHLLHVIEMFLNVTKMEAGKIDLVPAKTNLSDLVRSAVHDNHLSAKHKKLHLTVDVPKRAVFAMVDGTKIREVMFNFIENAIKYTPSGSVNVSLVATKKAIEFRVQDTGVGIAPEEVPKLFAKFVRAGGGFRVAHGSGLGLYIAKTITEAHKGTVFVESKGEKTGSTFGFRLPI